MRHTGIHNSSVLKYIIYLWQKASLSRSGSLSSSGHSCRFSQMVHSGVDAGIAFSCQNYWSHLSCLFLLGHWKELSAIAFWVGITQCSWCCSALSGSWVTLSKVNFVSVWSSIRNAQWPHNALLCLFCLCCSLGIFNWLADVWIINNSNEGNYFDSWPSLCELQTYVWR